MSVIGLRETMKESTHDGDPGNEVGGVAGKSEELSELKEAIEEIMDSSEVDPDPDELVEAR